LLTRVEIEGEADGHAGQGTPAGASTTIIVRTGIDARVVNDNVAAYEQLANRHLDTRHARVLDDGTILCEVATTQSRVRIGFAQRTTLTPHDGAAQHAGVTEQAGTAYQASPLQQAGATRRISTTPRIVDDHAGRQAVFLDHMVDVA